MDQDYEAKLDNGKDKKRKSSSMEERTSKLFLYCHHSDQPKGNMAKENGELSNSHLPSELWIKIIDMIPISQWPYLELISHQFQEVVYGLWGQQRDIRLDELVYKKEKKPFPVLESILRKFFIRAPNVASISGFQEFFGRGTPIRRETIKLLLKFKHLKSIDLSGLQVITKNNFAARFFLNSSASGQCWEMLDVGKDIRRKIMRNGDLSELFTRVEPPPVLNLECFKFNIETLRIIDRFRPIEWSQLKKLVITQGIIYLATEVLSIIRQCRQIDYLEIKVPVCRNGKPSFGEFMQVVAGLDNLSTLKIDCSDSGNLFPAALFALIQDLGSRDGFVDFSLMEYECTDQILGAIIDHLPHLKSLELNLANCPTTSLERLANKMGHLESLKLQFSFNSVPVGVLIRGIVVNMSSLQCLHLDCPLGMPVDFNILANLRKLKELRIRGIWIGGEIVETWARLGFGSCMETLELLLQDDISPEITRGFIRNMPRLRWLELKGDGTQIVI